MNDMKNVFLQVKGWRVDRGVCIIVLGCRGEYVYDGLWVGFYVCECAEVSSYVYLYEDVDVFEGYEVGFCVVCLGACIQYQRKMRLFHIIELYGFV